MAIEILALYLVGQIGTASHQPKPSQLSASEVTVRSTPETIRARRLERLEKCRRNQLRSYYTPKKLTQTLAFIWNIEEKSKRDGVATRSNIEALEPSGPAPATLQTSNPILFDQSKTSAHPQPHRPRWKIRGQSPNSLLAHRAKSSYVSATQRASIEFVGGDRLTKLVADRFLLDRATGKVEAEGNVLLSRDGQHWQAEYIFYDFWLNTFSELKMTPSVMPRVPLQDPAPETIKVRHIDEHADRPPANSLSVSIPVHQLQQLALAKAAWTHHPAWCNRTLRFSFEEIDMPDAGEHMGLYGIGAYDRFKPWLYGGLSAYGAATGRRGGFFTGGYTLGVEHQLTDNWILDAGGYVGAGGGGAAAQGGGLMVRPHIGLKYDFSWGALGLNYTYVDFPNGDISSDAIALSLDIPFSSPIRSWEDDEQTAADYFGADWSNVSRHRSHLAARVRAYSPSSGSKTTSGGSLDDSLGLVGVELLLLSGRQLVYHI